ncbi:hypothetical protein B4Q13_21105 [Lacticaseibacillus rhamnosus]
MTTGGSWCEHVNESDKAPAILFVASDEPTLKALAFYQKHGRKPSGEVDGEKKKTNRYETFWREFGHHLLFHFPHTPKKNFNPKFNAFRWEKRDAHALKRWKAGKTGIPIVDAGMRELWATGWMHK